MWRWFCPKINVWHNGDSVLKPLNPEIQVPNSSDYLFV